MARRRVAIDHEAAGARSKGQTDMLPHRQRNA